jgi:hypothetical protein
MRKKNADTGKKENISEITFKITLLGTMEQYKYYTLLPA